jgi:hypothetical protein
MLDKTGVGVQVSNQLINSLLFADDITWIANSEQELNTLFAARNCMLLNKSSFTLENVSQAPQQCEIEGRRTEFHNASPNGAWLTSSKVNEDLLSSIQFRAAKIIMKTKVNMSKAALLIELEWEPINDCLNRQRASYCGGELTHTSIKHFFVKVIYMIQIVKSY